ncbi:MAG: 3-dehydroquinate dehydratase-2 [Myxococcota bacterium]
MTVSPVVLLLNGPNLDRLGKREAHLYGTGTLDDVVAAVRREGLALGVEIVHLQSNHEGALVDAVHRAIDDGVVGAVVNAGAYTHTSVALRDALVGLPFVEIHISNVYAREPFRHRSLLADIAVGCVVGLGTIGYGLALRGLLQRVRHGGTTGTSG